MQRKEVTVTSLTPPPPHRFNSQYDSTGSTENKWLTIEISDIETGLEFARKNEIRYITFFDSGSQHELDLKVLREIPDPHGLELACKILDCNNPAPIYASKHLKQLFIRTDLPDLDLRHLPMIESLSFDNSRISGAKSAKNLIDVLVYNYNNKNSLELAHLPNLRKLELKGCRDQSLDHLSEYPSIHTLVLSYPEKLTNIEEIARSKTLKDLSIDYASKVEDYSPLGQNTSIESLYLRLKSLSSCEFARTMSSLTWIKIVARILDNSIQPILDSNSLLDAELLPVARSYTPKMTQKEITDYLRRKNG